MPAYAAFLRGVNLGAKRKVSGERLRECLESAGLEEARPFRTSGNATFVAPRQPRERLEGAIERALADALGFEVTVFVRTAAELAAIAEHQPFPAKAMRTSSGKLQVSLLGGKPTAAVRKQVLALGTDADRLAFEGRELYWLPSGPMSASELDVDAVDRLVAPSTRRTMGTIELLAHRLLQ
jgi:uncharacterized protein (DUF1697 family)